jgi:hypothetical protein
MVVSEYGTGLQQRQLAGRYECTDSLRQAQLVVDELKPFWVKQGIELEDS